MGSDCVTKVGIAYVGCGYVADLYQKTLSNWQDTLDLRGVFDIDPNRLKVFGDFYGVPTYTDVDTLLNDPTVDVVVNLTNPDQHYAVSKRCLEHGKHVYSEKPLALDLEQAKELIETAKAAGLHIVSAPSSTLGEAAQTLIKAVRDQARGTPRLIYAEIDDGLVHRMGYQNWRTASGALWPARDEFQTGCTLEHAGYALTWLVVMFGPVQRVVSYARCLIKDKGPDTPQAYTTPDYSCASLEFANGVSARLTNSIIAPHDHTFRVFCDDGILSLDETWDFAAKVRSIPVAETRLHRQFQKIFGWDRAKILKPNSNRKIATARRGYHMDFALGVAEMAQAIQAGRAPRLAGNFSLHITEVSLAIQHPERFGTEYIPQSTAQSVAPMDWS
ncbi:Gfo/Idh/MocA family oxidoreductase [Actibacterium sp. 188UL27-1]|nr:Gfo/Idh/MocA family oxidoreductase [Actibacterium sp. 188UL27-1]